MRARSIQRHRLLKLALSLSIRMIVEVELPDRFVKFRLLGAQLQGGLIFFDGVVEIATKGEAFGAQLVSTPGIRKGVLQLPIRLSPQRLVGALQPIARLSVSVADTLDLRERARREVILLQRKVRLSQQQPLRISQLLPRLQQLHAP